MIRFTPSKKGVITNTISNMKRSELVKRSMLLLMLSVFVCSFGLNDTKAKGNLLFKTAEVTEQLFEEMNIKNFKVASEEIIYDFNNNHYYLVNYYPIGYSIFEGNSKEFIEGSFDTICPYSNYGNKVEGENYYSGPLNYFIRNGNIIYDIYNKNYMQYSQELNTISSEFNKTLL